MTDKTNGGIEAAQCCAETIERWHRLIDWSGKTYAEPKDLSLEDRHYLMTQTDWRNDPDVDSLRESIEDEAREYPLSVEYRSEGWSLDPTDCQADAFRIMLCTGGPAVAIFGDIGCGGWPSDPVLKGQDWFTPWEEVDCDPDALDWFSGLFVNEC